MLSTEEKKYEPQDNPHQEILAEFDRHYIATGFDQAGQRWIKLAGKVYDIDTFLKYKLNQ